MEENLKRQPNEYGIIDPEYEKCNHRIKSKKTSIVLLSSQRTFTIPENIYGICKYCGKPFHYIRNANGALENIKDVKEEKPC